MRTLHTAMTSTKSWYGLLVLPPKNFIETSLTLAYVQTPHPPPTPHLPQKIIVEGAPSLIFFLGGGGTLI